MNRRFFTSLLAGAVLDPERLLWVPGAKLISIPKQKAIARWWRIWDGNQMIAIRNGWMKNGDVVLSGSGFGSVTEAWEIVRPYNNVSPVAMAIKPSDIPASLVTAARRIFDHPESANVVALQSPASGGTQNAPSCVITAQVGARSGARQT